MENNVNKNMDESIERADVHEVVSIEKSIEGEEIGTPAGVPGKDRKSPYPQKRASGGMSSVMFQ